MEIESLPGFKLYNDFITIEEENNLISFFDTLPWSYSLKRRVQHYGKAYNYSSKNLGEAPEIPELLVSLYKKIKYFRDSELPIQIIVNEYMPGQGISAHTDHHRHFGPVIATLSLGCEVPMLFKNGELSEEVYLPRRSVAFLTGDVRKIWTHEIKARKSDNKIERTRRISITFRTIIS